MLNFERGYEFEHQSGELVYPDPVYPNDSTMVSPHLDGLNRQVLAGNHNPGGPRPGPDASQALVAEENLWADSFKLRQSYGPTTCQCLPERIRKAE